MFTLSSPTQPSLTLLSSQVQPVAIYNSKVENQDTDSKRKTERQALEKGGPINRNN